MHEADRTRAYSIVVKIALVAAIPLLACSTYYTLERLGSAGPTLYIAASIALPVMLLGLTGTIRTVAAGRKAGIQLWLSGLALVLPALLLGFIWL